MRATKASEKSGKKIIACCYPRLNSTLCHTTIQRLREIKRRITAQRLHNFELKIPLAYLRNGEESVAETNVYL